MFSTFITWSSGRQRPARSCSPSSAPWPSRSSAGRSSNGSCIRPVGSDNAAGHRHRHHRHLHRLNALAGWIYGHRRPDVPHASSATSRWSTSATSPSPRRRSGSSAILARGRRACSTCCSSRPRSGLAMRAVASNAESAGWSASGSGRILMLGWGLAAAVGALAGAAGRAAAEPRRQNLMLQLLIYAFAAATLGGFDSPLGAVVGGLIVGVIPDPGRPVHRLLRRASSWRSAFLLILIVLLVRPQGLFGRAGGDPGMTSPRSPRPVGSVLGIVAVVVAALVLYLPQYFVEFRTAQLTIGHRHLDRRARPRPAHRVQRPDLGRPRRVLRHRRLHDGHPRRRPRVDRTSPTIPVADGALLRRRACSSACPALRISGLYLALVTLALATLFPLIIAEVQRRHRRAAAASGCRRFDPPDWARTFTEDQWTPTTSSWPSPWSPSSSCATSIRSRVGRAIIAIRDGETAAEVLGRQPGPLQGGHLRHQRHARRPGRLAVRHEHRRARPRRPRPVHDQPSRSSSWPPWSSAAPPPSSARSSASLFIVFVPEWSSDINAELSRVIFGGVLIVLMLVLPGGYPRRAAPAGGHRAAPGRAGRRSGGRSVGADSDAAPRRMHRLRWTPTVEAQGRIHDPIQPFGRA